jgi:acyl dehydratase
VGAVRPGDQLATVMSPRIGRLNLAYMAVAINDSNLIHLEDEAAHRAGLSGVIAHGTFAISYIGAVASRVAGIEAVRSLSVDLLLPVAVADQLVADGLVATVRQTDAGEVIHARLSARRLDGSVVARGESAIRVG